MRRWAHFASTIAVGDVRLGAGWFRYSKSRLELRDHELGVDAVAAMLAQSGYPYAACRKLVLERLRPGDLAGGSRDVLTERVLQCIAALRTLFDAEEQEEAGDEAHSEEFKAQNEESQAHKEESKESKVHEESKESKVHEESKESKAHEEPSDEKDGSRRGRRMGLSQDFQPFEDVHALIAATTFRNDEVKRTSFQVTCLDRAPHNLPFRCLTRQRLWRKSLRALPKKRSRWLRERIFLGCNRICIFFTRVDVSYLW